MTPLDEFKQFPFDKEKLNASHKGKIFRTYLKEVIYTEKCLKPVLEYLIKNNSANEVAEIISSVLNWKWTAGGIISMCRKFNIKTHSWSEAAKLPKCRKKHEETNLKRYGAKNPFCKGTSTYEKKLKTVQERYGVDNIRKSKEFQITRKKSMLKKYGVTNAIFLPTYERCTGRRSKLQKKVEEWLTNLGYSFEYEVPNKFLSFNEHLQREYNPIVDILLEDKKTVIEIYGDRWHANPRKYKAADIIPRWDGEVTVEYIWDVDKCRVEQIESFGYKVLILWETDINYNKDLVINLLKETLERRNE